MRYVPIRTIEKIKNNRFIKGVVSFGTTIGQRSIPANSASIAYYIFISMIPLFILLCSQLPLTGLSKSDMMSAVTDIIPESIKGLLTSIISEAYESRIGFFSISIVILLWSSSRGVLALIRALDIVYDEKDSRNIINMYVFSIFYTVCLLLLVSLLLVLYTHELTAEEILRSIMPSNKFSDLLAKNIKDFDVVFATTICFAAVYKIAPAGKRKFIHQLPGAVFSAVAISIFSAYFAIYTGGSNIYKSFYGSLTTVTILLIWVYSCINIFLIGGVINFHFQHKINTFCNIVISKFTKKKKDSQEITPVTVSNSNE